MVEFAMVIISLLNSLWLYFLGNILPYFVIYKKLKTDYKIKNVDVLIHILLTFIAVFLIISGIFPGSGEFNIWIIWIISINLLTLFIAFLFKKKNIKLMRYSYIIGLILTTIISYFILLFD